MSAPYNEPAFPVINAPGAPEDYPGMTLRDYFAAKALLGEINYQGLEGRETEHIAGMAYAMADAMLKARQS